MASDGRAVVLVRAPFARAHSLVKRAGWVRCDRPCCWFNGAPQITGCSTGLGRALALELHGRRGADGKPCFR